MLQKPTKETSSYFLACQIASLFMQKATYNNVQLEHVSMSEFGSHLMGLRQQINRHGGSIAQWISLCIPVYSPGLES